MYIPDNRLKLLPIGIRSDFTGQNAISFPRSLREADNKMFYVK